MPDDLQHSRFALTPRGRDALEAVRERDEHEHDRTAAPDPAAGDDLAAGDDVVDETDESGARRVVRRGGAL